MRAPSNNTEQVQAKSYRVFTIGGRRIVETDKNRQYLIKEHLKFIKELEDSLTIRGIQDIRKKHKNSLWDTHYFPYIK